MNKKTILILLVLAIAVLGFTMGPACAATTTIKMGKHKDVGSKDRILTFYQPKDAQNAKGVYAATVYYKNKKGKVITRTVKPSNISGLMLLSTPKLSGYTPYKSKITYTKMTKKEKNVIMNPLF